MNVKLPLILLFGIAFFEPENHGMHAHAAGQENALGRKDALERARISRQHNVDVNEMLQQLGAELHAQQPQNRKRDITFGRPHSRLYQLHNKLFSNKLQTHLLHNFLNRFKRMDHAGNEKSRPIAWKNSEFSKEN